MNEESLAREIDFDTRLGTKRESWEGAKSKDSSYLCSKERSCFFVWPHVLSGLNGKWTYITAVNMIKKTGHTERRLIFFTVFYARYNWLGLRPNFAQVWAKFYRISFRRILLRWVWCCFVVIPWKWSFSIGSNKENEFSSSWLPFTFFLLHHSWFSTPPSWRKYKDMRKNLIQWKLML